MIDNSLEDPGSLSVDAVQARPRLTPGGRQNNWYYATTPRALEDLRDHAGEVTYLVPFWYGVTAAGGLDDESDPETKHLASQRGVPVLAIIHNYASPEARDLIHQILVDPATRKALVRSILVMLNREHYAGVNVDLEFVPPEDREDLTAFVRELGAAISPLGYAVTVSVPAQVRDNPSHPFSGAFDYAALGRIANYLYILAYDEHFAVPGPVASIGFVGQVLDFAVTVIPRGKIVLGMAAYGYDWASEGGIPETLTYQMAVSRAERHGASIVFDEEAGEPTYTYVEDGVQHTVWFEDARSFGLKLNLARDMSLPGIAVWRMGQEDQQVWDIIRRTF